MLVLFGAALLAFRNLDKLMESSRLVEHTNAVMFKAESVYVLVKDAEAGSRGYILTHNSGFLDSYYNAAQFVGSVLDTLDVMTNDNPAQTRRIDSLKILIDQRFKIMSTSVNLSFYASNLDTVQKTLLLGKEIMDKARSVLNQIEWEEKRLLVERQAAKSKFYNLTPIWLGVISFLAVLVFILTFFKAVYEIHRRWVEEVRLEKTLKALKRSNEDLEQFAYVASHHLQEPLRKLRTFSDMLNAKHGSELGKDAAFLVQRIAHSATEMQSLVEDLLTFSQFGREYRNESFQPVPLRTVLDAALAEHSDTLRDKQAKVHIEGEFITLWGNPTQLLHLFSNLLENSLKFVHNNEVPLISISSTTVQGWELPGSKVKDEARQFCEIRFADQGIGFDEAFKDKIFQLFQRLQNKSDFKGTGVGLAICKKVIANHNGHLDVKSKINGGTVFIIYLPLAK